MFRLPGRALLGLEYLLTQLKPRMPAASDASKLFLPVLDERHLKLY